MPASEDLDESCQAANNSIDKKTIVFDEAAARNQRTEGGRSYRK